MILITGSCWRDKENTTSPGVRDDVKRGNTVKGGDGKGKGLWEGKEEVNRKGAENGEGKGKTAEGMCKGSGSRRRRRRKGRRRNGRGGGDGDIE